MISGEVCRSSGDKNRHMERAIIHVPARVLSAALTAVGTSCVRFAVSEKRFLSPISIRRRSFARSATEVPRGEARRGSMPCMNSLFGGSTSARTPPWATPSHLSRVLLIRALISPTLIAHSRLPQTALGRRAGRNGCHPRSPIMITQ